MILAFSNDISTSSLSLMNPNTNQKLVSKLTIKLDGTMDSKG
jgi:hypothetical protein